MNFTSARDLSDRHDLAKESRFQFVKVPTDEIFKKEKMSKRG